MNSFKQAAITILEQAKVPLHYRDITKRALNQGLITTDGHTPWATMSARLSSDVKDDTSLFVRTEPGYYYLKNLNINVAENVRVKDKMLKVHKPFRPINPTLNSKQKGDIAENRVAELITLYGDEGLSCYQPLSDDEGIDIIVKRRGELDVVYVQVKSSYGYKDRGFVSTVKEKCIVNKQRMLMVFVYFDLVDGDLFDQIFCIPAPDFLRLTANEDKKPGERVFTVGLKHPEDSKYSEFMLEKTELANKIVEIMDKL
jgi:hypothetical protein